MAIASPAAALPQDDAGLTALAKAGREDAVRAIVRANNQRLYRAARAVVRDDAEAEDVVQETYVRAFTGLDAFRGEARLSTWLTRIAINEAAGRVRRRRPAVGLDQLDAETEGARLLPFPGVAMPANPETSAARAQLRALLEHAVDGLPEPFRAVFILRDIEELSVEDTAAALSLEPATVKTRLHRARKLIRTTLRKQLGGGFAELFPFNGWRCDRLVARVVARLRAAGTIVD